MAIPGHCSAPARSSLLLRFLCFLWAAPAFADALPTRCWTNDVGRVNAAQLEVARGETIALEAQLTDGSGAFALPAGCAAALWWQTNGMARSWWQASASSTTGGLLRATWAPSNDCGAASYRFFISAAPGGTTLVYRAFGSIRMRDSPGASPNVLPLPAQTIDFSQVEVSNAPWLLPSATNALVSAVAATNIADAAAASRLPFEVYEHDGDDSLYWLRYGNDGCLIRDSPTNWTEIAFATDVASALSAAHLYTDSATNAIYGVTTNYVAGSYLSLAGGKLNGPLAISGATLSQGMASASGADAAAFNSANAAGANSLAAGGGNTTGGDFGTALGLWAYAMHYAAFCWSGASSQYGSKGDGTFCINPTGGAAGVWIGETNLEQTIRNYSPNSGCATAVDTNAIVNAARFANYGGVEYHSAEIPGYDLVACSGANGVLIFAYALKTNQQKVKLVVLDTEFNVIGQTDDISALYPANEKIWSNVAYCKSRNCVFYASNFNRTPAPTLTATTLNAGGASSDLFSTALNSCYSDYSTFYYDETNDVIVSIGSLISAADGSVLATYPASPDVLLQLFEFDRSTSTYITARSVNGGAAIETRFFHADGSDAEALTNSVAIGSGMYCCARLPDCTDSGATSLRYLFIEANRGYDNAFTPLKIVAYPRTTKIPAIQNSRNLSFPCKATFGSGFAVMKENSGDYWKPFDILWRDSQSFTVNRGQICIFQADSIAKMPIVQESKYACTATTISGYGNALNIMKMPLVCNGTAAVFRADTKGFATVRFSSAL